MSKELKKHLKKCKELMTSGDLDAALNETIFALAIDAQNYTAKIFKGKILGELKKFGQAEKIYRELIDYEPDKSLAYKETVEKLKYPLTLIV